MSKVKWLKAQNWRPYLAWFIHKLCRHQYLFSLISARYADFNSSRTFNRSQMLFFLFDVGIIYPSGGPIWRPALMIRLSSRAKRGDLKMIRQRHEIASLFWAKRRNLLRSSQRRLLRYRVFAVENHSCIPCASHPTTYILNKIVVASGAWQSGKLDPWIIQVI